MFNLHSHSKCEIFLYLFTKQSFPCFLFPRLALYVYEYLLHVGAQKSAQTFLSEVSVGCVFVRSSIPASKKHRNASRTLGSRTLTQSIMLSDRSFLNGKQTPVDSAACENGN